MVVRGDECEARHQVSTKYRPQISIDNIKESARYVTVNYLCNAKGYRRPKIPVQPWISFCKGCQQLSGLYLDESKFVLDYVLHATLKLLLVGTLRRMAL